MIESIEKHTNNKNFEKHEGALVEFIKTNRVFFEYLAAAIIVAEILGMLGALRIGGHLHHLPAVLGALAIAAIIWVCYKTVKSTQKPPKLKPLPSSANQAIELPYQREIELMTMKASDKITNGLIKTSAPLYLQV